MSDADAGPLHVERTDHDVVIATLRNGKVNALSTRVLDAVAEAADEWAENPPGAVILTGGSKLFAAGADIDQFVAAEDETDGAVTLVDGETARGIARSFRRAGAALESLRCPVIAEVSGYALGGGCELALTADLRIASDRARFGQPEILLGIIPGGGGTQRLLRLVGPSRAMDLVFTGRQVDAAEALHMGLVNEVVPHAELRERTLELATTLANGPRQAIGLAKSAISEGVEGTLENGLDVEEAAFAAVFATGDAAVGVGSFRQHGPGKASFSGR